MPSCVAGEAQLASIPAAWTNCREVDDLERASAGCSLFRADDLEALREFVDLPLEGAERNQK